MRRWMAAAAPTAITRSRSAPSTTARAPVASDSVSQAVSFEGTERFEIVRRLGAGGMGVVYEALDRERKTKVALKTLRALDGAALLRFKNEFRAMADLSHP